MPSVNPSNPLPDPPPVKNLELKAALLLLLMLALVVGSALYVLYARGAFERTQRLVLIADDSEGVVVGMDMTFAGFAIGRVTRIELGEDGNARILIDVPRKDARWLRQSSIFTMERGLVGGTRIRAFSGVLSDPPLPDGAERRALRGDMAGEIPQLMTSVRELTDNLAALTRGDAALAGSLANVQTLTGRMNGPQGVLGTLMGNEADAKKLVRTIEQANALLARADQLTQRLDTLVTHADRQVFGAGATADGGVQGGLVGDARATVQQLNQLLTDARASLQKVDAVLVEAKGIAANTRQATTDLDVLRGEVEASLRKVDGLINEINRKWPFKREAEIKLR
jgi:phospholipid/cholesterol/gamma-HCH transport system substrate-binding protein